MAPWVPLVVAGRIDVARGIIDDLKPGHIPNIFAAFGWQEEWKYNQRKFAANDCKSSNCSSGGVAVHKKKEITEFWVTFVSNDIYFNRSGRYRCSKFINLDNFFCSVLLSACVFAKESAC